MAITNDVEQITLTKRLPRVIRNKMPSVKKKKKSIVIDQSMKTGM